MRLLRRPTSRAALKNVMMRTEGDINGPIHVENGALNNVRGTSQQNRVLLFSVVALPEQVMIVVVVMVAGMRVCRRAISYVW